MKDKIHGGLADRKPDSAFNPKWLAAGIKVEMEHTDDPAAAKEIAKDHLIEDPLYYKKLRKIEKSMVAEMQKANDLVGDRGGHYHLDAKGKKVYTDHAKALEHVTTATKHALYALRHGKISHYEKARKVLAKHHGSDNEHVRKVVAAAHDIINRGAKEMTGRSKTTKAHHIYSQIAAHHADMAHKEHSDTNTPEKAKRAKSDFYQKKAEFHKQKMQEHSDAWTATKEKERADASAGRSYHKNHAIRDAHQKQYVRHQKKYESAKSKAATGKTHFVMSVTKSKKDK